VVFDTHINIVSSNIKLCNGFDQLLIVREGELLESSVQRGINFHNKVNDNV